MITIYNLSDLIIIYIISINISTITLLRSVTGVGYGRRLKRLKRLKRLQLLMISSTLISCILLSRWQTWLGLTWIYIITYHQLLLLIIAYMVYSILSIEMQWTDTWVFSFLLVFVFLCWQIEIIILIAVMIMIMLIMIKVQGYRYDRKR